MTTIDLFLSLGAIASAAGRPEAPARTRFPDPDANFIRRTGGRNHGKFLIKIVLGRCATGLKEWTAGETCIMINS